MDAAFLQRLRAADVVLPERVSAVDDGVASLQRCAKDCYGVFGDFPGGQHDPHDSRRGKFFDEVVKRRTRGCAMRCKVADCLGIAVVNHDLVFAFADEAARDVATHAPEADKADLHNACPVLQRGVNRGLDCGKTFGEVSLDMKPQGAAVALRQNVEVAARLRCFDNAEAGFLSRYGRSAASSAVI